MADIEALRKRGISAFTSGDTFRLCFKYSFAPGELSLAEGISVSVF
jgi:hypothetical protein